jgi:hypothetical protein
MKTLEEVKTLFEHKSFLVRSDFINEYDFNDDYFEYYRNFIIEARDVKDHMYLSDLMDLAGFLDIYDEELRMRYYKCLFSKQHYLVKLAVLDYFKHCKKELLPVSYEADLTLFVKKRAYPILKAQTLFNLICFGSTEVRVYLNQLNELLAKCDDWRAFYRIIMNIRHVKVDDWVKESICEQITMSHLYGFTIF